MRVLICKEMHQSIRYVFIILFPAADVVRVFGDKRKLSRITAVPQEHRRPRLIIKLLENPNKGTQGANNTTEMEVDPESIKFGRTLPHILQAIWEADPSKDPVQVSKFDTTNAYHRGMLRLDQVGAFCIHHPISIRQ